MRGKLYFTVGLARSGKSTLCESWVNYKSNIFNGESYVNNSLLNSVGKPRVIVCGDDIRLALHGQRFCRLAEDFVHATKHLMIRSLLNRGHDVIVDGTHTTENSILKLLRIDRDSEFVYIDTNADICKQRAIDTKQEDLLPVIDRHDKNIRILESKYGSVKNCFENLREFSA